MKRLHYSISIQAPKEKVWETMLNDETYRKWTAAFHPGSHYKGSWEQGSEIQFLGPDQSGKYSGMYSRIKENQLYKFISIEHLGFVNEGVVDESSEHAKGLRGALENYTFKDLGNKTELVIEMDSSEEYEKMFENTWPQALQILKKLSEG